MIHFLVINHNKNGMWSYAEQYRVFTKRDVAIAHFKTIGGEENPMGFGLSKKVGVASVQKSGLIDVTFMPIEVQ